MYVLCCFFFKQKTAYEMSISDWSSDVCSSDLLDGATGVQLEDRAEAQRRQDIEDFHGGKKMALVFSTGAGGSSLSYHAKTGSKNTRRRIHYVIQLGYRADEVTQGFGRTQLGRASGSERVCQSV